MKTYCFKCCRKINMPGPKPVILTSGRQGAEGFCPHCKGRMTRVVVTGHKK